MQLKELIKQNPLSKFHYISGQKALNIYDFENKTGDWHFSAFWGGEEQKLKKFSLMGTGEKFNTNPFLGDLGVFEASKNLALMGKNFNCEIWAANHSRAISDIIICNALEEGEVNFFTLYEFDAWFPTADDKQKVYFYLELALKKLSVGLQNPVLAWLKKAKEMNFEL